MEDQQQLVDLKGQIIKEITPLLERDTVDPEQKFAILMLVGRNQGDDANIKAAHEAAKTIKDDDAKLDALMQLLEEVDFRLRPQGVQGETDGEISPAGGQDDDKISDTAESDQSGPEAQP